MGGWGAASQPVAAASVSPLLLHPGRPHFPLESSISAGGWAIERRWERGRVGMSALGGLIPREGVFLDLRTRVTPAVWWQSPSRMGMTSPTSSFLNA